MDVDENRFVGANIQADVLIVDLFHFWGGRADLEIIDTMQFPEQHPQVLQLGKYSRYDHQNDVSIVIAFVNNQAWISYFQPDVCIQKLREEFQCEQLFNDIGQLKDCDTIKHDMILFDSHPPVACFTGDHRSRQSNVSQ